MVTVQGKLLSAAERIQNACLRTYAQITLADGKKIDTPISYLLPDRTLALLLPASAINHASPQQETIPTCVELIDYAPLQFHEPVRALIWLQGSLQLVPDHHIYTVLDTMAKLNPHPALLQVYSPHSQQSHPCHQRYDLAQLTITSAILTDPTGSETVDLNDLFNAQPDPFCLIETEWIRHLDAAHPEIVERLASHTVPLPFRRRARPLGVDRYGLWLRIESPQDGHDIRLPFPSTVTTVGELNRAIRILLGCPFFNGLQARS